jgi:ADP-ribose pyrophosphatase YjhB (NUDIX family)
VVFNSENKVLLLEHSFRSGSGWVSPGGFIEANEQPEEAIKREIFEEASLEIRNLKLVSIRTRLRHLEILFRAEADGIPNPNSYEIRKAKWFPTENLPPNLNETQKSLIEKTSQATTANLSF